jgi:hypothetical protein
MKKTLLFLTLLIIFSCTEDKWESFPENKFIDSNILDTTQYHNIKQEFNGRKIRSPSFEAYSYYHFYSPMALDNKYVFVEKKHSTDKNKNVIIKLNKKGEIVDSITINKYSEVINNYILERDYYISWLIDNDKTKKTLINKNYFIKSDTLKIKDLVKNFKKNKVAYWSTDEYDNTSSIDTCNYIISFEDNKLFKYNYSRKIRTRTDLKIKNENPDKFSERFKKIEELDSENYIKVDGFFAYTSDRLVSKGTKIQPSDLFSNTGVQVTPCNAYKGTYFFTILGLKLKIANQRVCEHKSIQESFNKITIYSADFLDFYILDLPFIENEIPYYGILKK